MLISLIQTKKFILKRVRSLKHVIIAHNFFKFLIIKKLIFILSFNLKEKFVNIGSDLIEMEMKTVAIHEKMRKHIAHICGRAYINTHVKRKYRENVHIGKVIKLQTSDIRDLNNIFIKK
jgi:hypothetical protein